jgi:hypothetical protein
VQVLNAGPKGGDKPGPSDDCKVHYTGKLIDGKVFDSSYKRNVPATFKPNQVVKGWTEALQLMTPGDKWELTIPPQLGYGMKDGRGPGPGGSVLVFELELLDIATPGPLMAAVGGIPVLGPVLASFNPTSPSHLVFVAILLFQFWNLFGGGGGASGKKRVALSEVAGLDANPKVFLDVSVGGQAPLHIEFELFSSIVPKTAEK